MTQGRPWKVLTLFSIPLILSALIQQLYGLIDMAIVGNFAGVAGALTGEQAVGAVSASFTVANLFIMLGMGGSLGCGVVISQLYGSRRYAEVKTTIYTSLIFFAALAVAIAAVCAALAEQMTRAMDTPADVFVPALDYLRVFSLGLPFLFLYNVCNAIFNALGDSKKPLYFLALSSALNGIVAYLFVAEFGWSVKGAAWATFLAQGAACLVSLAVLLKKVRAFHADGAAVRAFDAGKLRAMLRIGVPGMLQMSIVSVGMIIVQRLVNGFDDSAFLAGYSSAARLQMFFSTAINTAGAAVSTFAAQNIGAGRYDRVSTGARTALGFNLVFSLAVIGVSFLWGEWLIGLFMKEPSAEALRAGVFYMRVTVVGLLFFSCFNIFNGIARGAGYMPALTVSTLSDIGARVAFALALNAAIGKSAIAISVVVGWVLGCAISAGYHFSGRWKLARRI